MPSFFADGMVLQQETGAAIWGWAAPGEKAEVAFAGQVLRATADADGRWQVVFKGLQASKQGQELQLRVGADTKTIQDVLVGEVWIASGQSNMEWMMKQSDSKNYAKTVHKPLIRQYVAENVSIAEPQSDYAGKWLPATPEHTPDFSATAFHFAEQLHAELDVPIGIFELSWGGKPIQAFISDASIRSIPEAEGMVTTKANAIAAYDPAAAQAKYVAQQEAHAVAQQQWIDGGKQGRGPRAPRLQVDPAVSSRMHSTIYNGMIHPFVGYGIRGAIWYQGEANQAQALEYDALLAGLVADWRALWADEFSFYWVQLAAFREPTTEPGVEDRWVDLQNEQRRALERIAKGGMAVTNDIGALGIHPGNKKDVGLRLARWALYQDYGRTDVLRSGPLFKSATFEGPKAIVRFDYAEGLTTRDGQPLARFELAGPDGQWVWADAVIEGETVVVSAASVTQASQVRYAWARNPAGANLVNAAGLPASCFVAVAE